MEKWNVYLQRYTAARQQPANGGHQEYKWFNGVKLGFDMDHLRAEMDLTERHLARILEPLKPAIVKLPAFYATNLQKFVGRLSIYSYCYDPSNPHFVDAYADVEMLVHKLRDYEEGERRKTEELQSRKGAKGLRKQLHEALAKEGVSSFVKWFYTAVGALLFAAALTLWRLVLSKLFR
jgi:hypothetical protein